MSNHEKQSQPLSSDRNQREPRSHEDGGRGQYVRFGLMVLTASVVMYAVMYLNTYSVDHVYWSWTRSFMTMMSAATMMVIMLGFMLSMYRDRKANAVIVALAVVLFGAGLFLVRSQATVGDVAWMRAMIPHHSIAILTSERAHIEDPRVRELADSIIDAQRKEIDEMQTYIGDLESR
ncbi:MAG TPA: DUF305 domain-containing protein [Ornithinibacter sp.]|nr:DUF305 domain-containing protein [Ornithinibacter sp.]